MKLLKGPKVINKVVSLPVEQIYSNPDQPRRNFDADGIAGLAQSISQNGLLQPITVTQIGESYQLVAGERRLMACRELGWAHIPAIIENIPQQNAAVLALVENLHRQDLNIFEEAQGIANLIRLTYYSQQQAAQLLCKSQSTVANKLRLLRLPPSAQQAILQAGLTERHARALLQIEDEDQLPKAIEHIVEQGLTVAAAEQYIEKLVHPEAVPIHKGVIRDVRLLFNTIAKAVLTVQEGGLDVEAIQTEDDTYINYIVRIPKENVYIPPEHRSQPDHTSPQAMRA